MKPVHLLLSALTAATLFAGQAAAARPAQSARENICYSRPVPNGRPVFLRDMVEVTLQTANTYWKVPNQNDYTSWVPRVVFEVFYDDSAKLRYTADWFNPDGSLWFSEALNYGYSGTKTARIASDYSQELLSTKAVTANGTYGLKLTNAKTNEVVFQGKFKVNKLPTLPGVARYKNQFEFFVDNDWNLPIGYVGFNYDSAWSYPQPTVFMWFKGRLETKDFEARLYHGGQEVASTDEGGNINSQRQRGSDCLKFVDACRYHLWEFYWPKFMVENTDWVRRQKPNSIFTKDRPGEYTVKVFHKGVQVRETRFTIDPQGLIAANAFSAQMPLSNYKVVVPVKVLGTPDKWNAATWRTDAFYGNPLSGFGVQ